MDFTGYNGFSEKLPVIVIFDDEFDKNDTMFLAFCKYYRIRST